MELWIRSQDKTELIKVNNVKIAEYNGYYYIVTGVEDLELGEYCSYDRVEEILNEIQTKINNIANIDDENYIKAVYEMPEK